MELPKDALCTLHRIHRQLSELRSRLARGPKQIAAGDANMSNLSAALDQAKESLQRLRMAADEKELQLKEREGRIGDIKVKMNAASSNREYQAFVEQIAADEQANSVLSDEILELFEKVTEQEASVGQAEANLQLGRDELTKIRARVDGERDKLESEISRLSGSLQAAESQLPSDIRGDYDRIVKARGDDGMAGLDGEYCGGCFQQVTQQTLNELRLSRFVLCKSCGRILYLPEDTTVR